MPSHDQNVSPFELVEILVAQEAVRDMIAHSKEGYPLEIGGYLIGRKYTDPMSNHVVTYIDQVLRADTESTHTHVTFLPSTAVRLHRRCTELKMHVVAYYHSHPGFGVFQSGEDVENFTFYYPNSHQVAVVIDPTKVPNDETMSPNWIGFFGWNENKEPQLLTVPLVRLVTSTSTTALIDTTTQSHSPLSNENAGLRTRVAVTKIRRAVYYRKRR